MGATSQPRSEKTPLAARDEKLLELFTDFLHMEYSKRSVPEYRRLVLDCARWLATHGIALADTRPSDLQAYQDSLLQRKLKSGQPYAASTIRSWVDAVKALFRFLFRRGYLAQDPAQYLEFRVKEMRLPRAVLSPTEIQRVISGIKGPAPVVLRDRAVVETLYATGLRITELASLGLDDVDTEALVVRVELGKGQKGRVVPLTQPAAEAIEAYLAKGRPRLLGGGSTPYLFISDKGGWLHRAVVGRMLRRAAKVARIKKRVSAHVFRHSVATHLLQNRADIRHIQKLLGHARLSTTERYTRVEMSDLKKVIARAHPRAR